MFQCILKKIKAPSNEDRQLATDTINKNWERNRCMVDLTHTPIEYKNIIDSIVAENKKPSTDGLYSYFVKNKMPLMLNCINDFMPAGEEISNKKLSFTDLKKMRGK